MKSEFDENIIEYLRDIEENTDAQAYNEKIIESDMYWNQASEYEINGMLQEAELLFWRCYLMRESLLGKDDWYTQMAKRAYAIVRAKIVQDIDENVMTMLDEYLEFCLANTSYEDVNSIDALRIEGDTLYLVIVAKMRYGVINSEQLNRYYYIAQLLNDDAESVNVHLKYAENMMGLFYLYNAEFLLAEKAFLKALEMELDYDGELPDNIIRINLLNLYCELGDCERFIEILNTMDVDEEGYLAELELFALYKFYSIVGSMSIKMGMIESNLFGEYEDEYRVIINDAIELFMNEKPEIFPDYTNDLIRATMMSICYFYDKANEVEQNTYFELLKTFESKKEVLKLDNDTIIKNICMLSAYSLDEEMITTFFEIINNENVEILNRIQYMSLFLSAARERVAADYLLDMVKVNTASICECMNKYILFANDDRLLESLSIFLITLNNSYVLIRELVSDIEGFEYVAQFKAFSSLIGRERNRLSCDDSETDKIVKEIRHIHNNISSAKVSELYLNCSKDVTEEKEKLRKLEYEYALHFPKDIKMTDISYKGICEAVPDNSAIIEYYQFYDDESVFDVYLLMKVNGACELSRRTMKNGEELIELANSLSEIYNKESNGNASIDELAHKSGIQKELFENILSPELDVIEKKAGINTIYIAPVDILSNISFGIMRDDENARIEDRFDIVFIECARDFIFDEVKPFGNGSFIMGNPVYSKEIDTCEIKDKTTNRANSYDYTGIAEIPFTELEIQLVSQMCGSEYYSGKSANKNIFLNAAGCKNIHIATHGLYDRESEDGLYSSQLLLSGAGLNANDEMFGNGILTADEISRMKLNKCELVVLSSCLGGRNDSYYLKEFVGLTSAFMAAGVKYIISNLWYSNDFSTALLMKRFYYYYIEKNMLPQKALKTAKRDLSSMTMRDIKEMGVIDYALNSIELDEKSSKMLQILNGRGDDYIPFRDEIFWGGFICYQCY